MRKFFTVFAALVCAAELWAQTPEWVKDGDAWDEETKTLTVHSNPLDTAYSDINGEKHIQHVVIGTEVTKIGYQAFYMCEELEELTFAEGSNLDTIAMLAFAGCELTSIELPAGIEYIGESAFGCLNLEIVIVHAAHCSAGGGAPVDTFISQNLAHIYVPASSVEWYTKAAGWNNLASFIEANPVPEPDSLTVTFAAHEAEGAVPAAMEIANGDTIVIPVNRTLYKQGHTLIGWSDGAHIHAIDSAFTPNGNTTLTAVFEANEANILQTAMDVTVAWDFMTMNGAPGITIEPGAADTAILVAQARWSDYTVDVKLDIDARADGALFNNENTGDWAQVHPNTKFRFVSKPHAILQVYTYVEPAQSTLDGWFCDTWLANEATFTVSSITGSSEFVNKDAGQWFRWMKVTYPGSGSESIGEIIVPDGKEIVNRKSSNRKFIKDGQLLIEKNGKTYNSLGVEMK